jgi:hypothetical protein
MHNSISTLAASFDLPLRHAELPAFRGAMASFVGLQQDLFHNHDNDPASTAEFRNRYPLIQFRVHRGQASIFGINAGAEALESLIFQPSLQKFELKGRRCPLTLSQHYRDRSFRPEVKAAEQPFRYRIYHYLPFAPRSYHEYQSTFDVRDKMDHLARLLRNHIVAFAWGVGWELPSDRRVAVTINQLDRVSKVSAKGQPMMAFDLEFSTNARLPEGVGLGRKTAFGFGVIIGERDG